MLFLGLILILHLHFQTVYQSNWVQSHMKQLVPIAFALPLLSVIPTLAKKQIMNPGLGSTCFVGPDMANGLFYIPFAVLVSLAMLIHVGTMAHVVKVSTDLLLYHIHTHTHTHNS